METRQKRVMPSRAKTFRGAPGVGNGEVDTMILDTYKRKEENEPLIPEQSEFFLTTSLDILSSFIDSDSDITFGTLKLNNTSSQRYFDRPEVLKAYREQEIIQTPEFVNISETPSVGGRFRPRSGEESSMDTSDATYEKRHKKYETFEKRLRLREKEKLKHEQYKLKERIDQLKSMDASAFLSLPDDMFPLPSGHQPLPDDDDNDGLTAAQVEGERRRNEMLKVAINLEERYRILLPPDRTWRKYADNVAPSEPSEQQQSTRHTSRRASTAARSMEDEAPPARETITLKIPPRFATKPTPVQYHSKKNRLDAALSAPPAKNPPDRLANDSISAPPTKKKKGQPVITMPRETTTFSLLDDDYSSLTETDDEIPLRSEDAGSKKQARGRSKKNSATPGESMSAYLFRSPSPVYASAENVIFTDRSNSILVIAALRSASAAIQRKTIRHLNAFGVKLPDMESREYDLPKCITEDIALRLHGPDSESGSDLEDNMQVED